jgi:YihY family inner membrane protein
VLKRSAKGFQRDNLSDWAAALTYRGVLCLAPGLLVLVSVLGLLGKSTSDKLLANVGDLAPGGVRSVIEQIVHNVQGRTSAGLAGLLALMVALWSASSYVAAFMRASNAIYEVGEGRPVWKTIPVRLAVTVIVVVLLVISAAIVVFTGPLAERLGQAIGVGHTAVTVFDIVKWPVLVVLVSLMLAILYYACPNVKQSGVQWISPGGVLAVFIWIAASGPVRRVRRQLRLVQQDLRHTRKRDHLPGLVVAHQPGDPPRRGVQRGAAARSRHRRRCAAGLRQLRPATRHPQPERRRPSAGHGTQPETDHLKAHHSFLIRSPATNGECT